MNRNDAARSEAAKYQQQIAHLQAELVSANAALQAEISDRQRVEQISRGQTAALVSTLNTLALEPVFENCLGFML